MESEGLSALSYSLKLEVFEFILTLLDQEGKSTIADRLYSEWYGEGLALAA